MKTISSTQNTEIKLLNKLKTPKGRDQENKFIGEGIRICSTLIDSNAKLIQIYITENMKDQVLEFANESQITLVSESIMRKISQSTTPSGVIGLFEKPQQPNVNLLQSGIVLAQISDPGNMGTLIRSAIAMGIKSVVIVEGTDPWAQKVIQSSAGTITQANIFQWSWQKLLENKKQLKLCALVVSGGKAPEKIKQKDLLLVVGNEAKGIPQEWLNQCEEQMTIPMPGKTESLNASVAGSIAMYLTFVNS